MPRISRRASAPVSVMGSEALVSVIVSTRNHAKTLGKTVRAVLEQDLDVELEMIVVDNASVDGTTDLMEKEVERASRPLTYVRLPADLAPAGGRNAGLALARGQFVAFTDSDCTPDPLWLRSALGLFALPEVGIVQGRTEAASKAAPLFSHYIETVELDGSFSTSNDLYRREA